MTLLRPKLWTPWQEPRKARPKRKGMIFTPGGGTAPGCHCLGSSGVLCGDRCVDGYFPNVQTVTISGNTYYNDTWVLEPSIESSVYSLCGYVKSLDGSDQLRAGMYNTFLGSGYKLLVYLIRLSPLTSLGLWWIDYGVTKQNCLALIDPSPVSLPVVIGPGTCSVTYAN